MLNSIYKTLNTSPKLTEVEKKALAELVFWGLCKDGWAQHWNIGKVKP